MTFGSCTRISFMYHIIIFSRENAGESVANNKIEPALEDDVPVRQKSGFSAFAALSVDDAGGPEPEDDEDFGGLMVRVTRNFHSIIL